MRRAFADFTRSGASDPLRPVTIRQWFFVARFIAHSDDDLKEGGTPDKVGESSKGLLLTP
jgi:hypothetical protein